MLLDDDDDDDDLMSPQRYLGGAATWLPLRVPQVPEDEAAGELRKGGAAGGWSAFPLPDMRRRRLPGVAIVAGVEVADIMERPT